MVFNKWCCSGS